MAYPIWILKLLKKILKINLPFDNITVDGLIWTKFGNDGLSFKDAYNCIRMDHIDAY